MKKAKFPRYVGHPAGFTDCAFLYEISETEQYRVMYNGIQAKTTISRVQRMLDQKLWVVLTEAEAEKLLR